MADGSVTRNQLIKIGAVMVLLVALTFVADPYRLFQLTMVVAYACAVLGLTILTGINGQISLGHGAFFAIGSYAAAILMAFVLQERRSPRPLLPLSIFRSRTLAAGDAVTSLVGAWTGGQVLILSLFCQQVLGYSPLVTGLVVVPQGVAGLLRGAVGASLVDRLGVKRFLVLGTLLSVVGLALLLRFSATSHYPLLGLVLFVVGFGTTSAVFGATVAGTAGVSDDEQGTASALVNAARQVGSAIGVATLVSIAAASARTNGGSPTATAGGYRLAMGAAAALAVVATVISALFAGERECAQQHDRLRRHGCAEPWPTPELLGHPAARTFGVSGAA